MRKISRVFMRMLIFSFMASICICPAEAATTGQKPAPAETAPQKPDLIITSISVTSPRIAFGSKDSRIIFAVKNQSQTPIQGNIKCQVVGKAASVVTIPYGLTAGQEKECSLLIGYDSTWPVGVYRIKVKADSPNAVAESNENNNESQEISFEIVPAATSQK